MRITQRHVDVATDMIEGTLSLAKIAEKHGVTPRLLTEIRNGWRGKPEFQVLLREIGSTYVVEIRSKIRRRFQRIAKVLFDQIEAEGQDPRVVQGAIDRLLRLAEEPAESAKILTNVFQGGGGGDARRYSIEEILARSGRSDSSNGNGVDPLFRRQGGWDAEGEAD